MHGVFQVITVDQHMVPGASSLRSLVHPVELPHLVHGSWDITPKELIQMSSRTPPNMFTL